MVTVTRRKKQSSRIVSNADTFLSQLERMERKMERNAFTSLPLRERWYERQSGEDICEAIDKACKYPIDLTTEHFLELFKREGIANRVVTVFPQESWSLDPWVYETEEPKETEFEKAWEALEKRLNLYHYLERVDILSGIGTYGVLFLGFNDGRDPMRPVVSLNERGEFEAISKKKLDLLYVRPLDETLVKIVKVEKDKRNPRCGLPVIYELTFVEQNAKTGEQINETFQCHWSRIIHVADNRMTSEIYGMRRIEVVYNRILDMKKTVGGSGEMFWNGAFPGISFEALPEVALGEAELDKTALKEEIRKYQEGLQRFVTLIGMKANSLAPQIADPEAHVRVEVGLIAAALPVPLRVFLGSEEAKLASTTDIRTHNKRINRRRLRYLTPFLLNPLVKLLITVGALPKPKELQIAWPDLNEMGKNDQATTAVKFTDALSKYVASGVDQIIPLKHFLTGIIGLTVKEADVIVTAAEEQKKTQSRIVMDDAEMAKKTAEATAPIEEKKLKLEAKLAPRPMAGGKPGAGGAKGGKGGKRGPSGRAKIASKSVRSPGPKTESSV